MALDLINLVSSRPQNRKLLGVIKDGGKRSWWVERPPKPYDLKAHLEGRRLLGVVPDKVVHLDLDHTDLKNIKPLVDVLNGLGIPAYVGPGNTRGSKCWIFLEAPQRDLETLSKGLARMTKLLLGDGHTVEGYPNGKRGVFLPLFGALNGAPKPLYEAWSRKKVSPQDFAPTYADPEGLRRLVKAVPFFEVALQKRPEGPRHDAAMTILNLAHRAGVLEEVKALLGSEAVYRAWGLEDSRTLEAWREELARLAEAAASPEYDHKRGLPFLKEVGLDPGPILGLLPGGESGWGEPLPLYIGEEAPPDYPVEALGPLQGVVVEAARVNMAAVAATAASFLAAAALGAQGVASAVVDGRVYPASLYFLSILASGERKSETDRLALMPARARQRELVLRAKAAMADWKARLEAWEHQKKLIVRDKRKSLEEKAAALERLGPPPERPWGGYFLHKDFSMEAVVAALADEWPAAGLFVPEAGVFLGGYAMSEEKRLYAIAVLSELWDGSPVNRARQGDGYLYVEGRRLSAHLAGQPEVVLPLFRDPLVRGQGLLYRFLTAWPAPIRNRRYVEEDLTQSPAFQAYSRRLGELLEAARVEEGEDGKIKGLNTAFLRLEPAAKRLYAAFYEHAEAAKDSAREEVSPFLSRAAEHAVRLALVLAIFEDPSAASIPLAHMEAAVRLVEWYIMELERIFGAAKVSERVRRAEALLTWIVASGREKKARGEEPAFTIKELLQHGPRSVAREARKLREVLATLEEHGYVRIRKGRGRGEVVEVNPHAL